MALNIKRITVEDFSKDDRDTVSRLATIFNPLFDQLLTIFNKGINLEYLSQELTTISFTTNDVGQPMVAVKFNTTLTARITAIIVASATLGSGQSPLTSAPFINYRQDDKAVTITYIAGLEKNSKYQINLLII